MNLCPLHLAASSTQSYADEKVGQSVGPKSSNRAIECPVRRGRVGCTPDVRNHGAMSIQSGNRISLLDQKSGVVWEWWEGSFKWEGGEEATPGRVILS
jgi:hypothetical protein